MKKIPLTQGKYAIVDDEDYEVLNQFKWCAKKSNQTSYAIRGTGPRDNLKRLYMHSEILPQPQGKEIDHRDGNGLNNTRSNLRFCTRQQNCANKRTNNKKTSSQYKGVCFTDRAKPWLANISFNNNTKFIGYFYSEINAAKAYDKKARDLFGEFANTNF